MGHHDGNVQDFGIFSFAIASPQTLLGQFVDAMARGARPKFFTLPDVMRDRGIPMLRRLGITESDKVVTFHARTAGTHAAVAYHDYRNARLENYEPLLRHLLDQGFWVVRLGDAGSPDMPFTHDRLDDLPKLPDYQDYMDVVVADRSAFGVVCDSGPEALFRILGKPILRVNSLITHHAWLGPDDLLMMKTFRDRRQGRVLGYKQILARGLSCALTARDLDRLEVEVLENSPEELLAAGIEMLDRLAGQVPDDAALQERFRGIGGEFQSLFKTWPPERRLPGAPLVTCFGFALPWVKHASTYFEAHPEFLGD